MQGSCQDALLDTGRCYPHTGSCSCCLPGCRVAARMPNWTPAAAIPTPASNDRLISSERYCQGTCRWSRCPVDGNRLGKADSCSCEQVAWELATLPPLLFSWERKGLLSVSAGQYWQLCREAGQYWQLCREAGQHWQLCRGEAGQYWQQREAGQYWQQRKAGQYWQWHLEISLWTSSKQAACGGGPVSGLCL